jgi:hypothetical protein
VDVLCQEQRCAVEGLVNLVEDAGKVLEDVRHAGGDVKNRVHARGDRPGRHPR